MSNINAGRERNKSEALKEQNFLKHRSSQTSTRQNSIVFEEQKNMTWQVFTDLNPTPGHLEHLKSV